MIFHCDHCGAALPGGTQACAACGRQFDTPVPADGEAVPDRVEALLHGRTANTPPSSASPAPRPTISPQDAGGPRPGRRATVWAAIGAGAILVLSTACLGAYTLWMHGPGGEKSFMQHNLSGNADVERGDFAAADTEYGQMIALRPQRVAGYMLRAISEFKQGLMSQSINDDTAALARTTEPMERATLLYNRGQAYGFRGSWPQAITNYTQAIQQYHQESDPQMRASLPSMVQETLRQRADAYWMNKNYTQAIADSTFVITHAISHRPQDYGVRAKAEAALGNDTAARADFNRALSLDPTYVNVFQGISNLADKDHQYAQAVAAFQGAVRAEPSHVQFWGSLGWFQYKDGQTRQALATDLYAQSLDPTQSWINYNLALCYAVLGDRLHASAAYDVAVARGSQRDQQEGLSDLRKALARQPSSATLQAVIMQVEQGQAGTNLEAPVPSPAHLSPPLRLSPTPHIASALAAQLAPEQMLSGCAIRPPVGFTLQKSQQEALSSSEVIYLWTGHRRSDGTAPDMELTVEKDDGSVAAMANSAQAVQIYLTMLKGNHSHLKSSPVSTSTINGRTFAYADWSGVGQHTGKQFQGIIYISITSGQFFRIISHDAAPHSRTTLPLLKAAVLTFRQT